MKRFAYIVNLFFLLLHRFRRPRLRYLTNCFIGEANYS